MDPKETRAFAQRLMKEVWEPFSSSAVSRFYHQDVVGHHRRPSETQELSYGDVVNRLAWDKETNANAAFDYRDIIAEEDRFALRFLYVADFVPTGGKIDVEMMYFYHLREAKVAEFWLQASVDFDYKAKA
jgi:SnoaL-like polyketide cyclase